MKLPNAAHLDASIVRRIVAQVGRARLASCLHVEESLVTGWMVHGVQKGPSAAILRQMAIEDGLEVAGDGACVFCGDPAHVRVAKFPVCTTCRHVSDHVLQPLGLVYRTSHLSLLDATRDVDAIRVGSSEAFEKPLFVKFDRQKLPALKKDPELGDEAFDAGVWIETDEYEAVFDTFMLLRRRQLVWDLTRTGSVTINVNEVLYQRRRDALPGRDVPILTALLAWSLRYERSDPWAF